jgi:TPR repeat protein
MIWLLALLSILFFHPLVVVAQEEGVAVELSKNLYSVALLGYARAKMDDIQQDNLKSPSTLYQIAKGMSNHDATRDTAVQIFHVLAADIQHIPSQVALGFYYYKNKNDDDPNDYSKHKALQYFQQAGENGPHQAALTMRDGFMRNWDNGYQVCHLFRRLPLSKSMSIMIPIIV